MKSRGFLAVAVAVVTLAFAPISAHAVWSGTSASASVEGSQYQQHSGPGSQMQGQVVGAHAYGSVHKDGSSHAGAGGGGVNGQISNTGGHPAYQEQSTGFEASGAACRGVLCGGE